MSAATRPENTESASEPRGDFDPQPLSAETRRAVCDRCGSSFMHGRSRFLFGEYLFLVIVEWLGLMKIYPIALAVLTSINLIPNVPTLRVLICFCILTCFVATYGVWATERKHNEPSR